MVGLASTQSSLLYQLVDLTVLEINMLSTDSIDPIIAETYVTYVIISKINGISKDISTFEYFLNFILTAQ
jgi:hypothetical protein